jgi:hypothetical protein
MVGVGIVTTTGLVVAVTRKLVPLAKSLEFCAYALMLASMFLWLSPYARSDLPVELAAAAGTLAYHARRAAGAGELGPNQVSCSVLAFRVPLDCGEVVA